jgi:hypothetical protein
LSKPTDPTPVKLVVSIISSSERLILDVLDAVNQRFGPVDYLSKYLPFAYTDYYESEMGSELKRRLISFQELVAPDSLPDVKLFTNSIEDGFTEDGKRRVNIDPGYLTQYHLILATGKRYAHRPYLRNGIYADLTLIYRNKSFQPLEWTYPDYAGEDIRAILEKIRGNYLRQLKSNVKRAEGNLEAS